MTPQRAIGMLAAVVAACAIAATAGGAVGTAIGAASTAGTAGTAKVKVYFPRGATGTSCARVHARARTVATPGVLRGAMAALLRGPTRAERARGYRGWFSARTAGRLRSVRIARGVAYIDLRDLRRIIPNASTSCGSALLLAQLNRTARQFPAVRRTVYSFDGDVGAFYEWLQLSPP